MKEETAEEGIEVVSGGRTPSVRKERREKGKEGYSDGKKLPGKTEGGKQVFCGQGW